MSNSCNGCGLCCRLFHINLSRQEYQSGKYQTMFAKEGIIENFTLAKSSGANFLAQKTDGSCIYLDGTQCNIHATRPKVCRAFFCTSKAKKFAGMVKIISKSRSGF